MSISFKTMPYFKNLNELLLEEIAEVPILYNYN